MNHETNLQLAEKLGRITEEKGELEQNHKEMVCMLYGFMKSLLKHIANSLICILNYYRVTSTLN